MKPKKYPYLGRVKVVRKELPRFVKLGDIALSANLVSHIQTIQRVDRFQTRLFLKLPKFFTYEEVKMLVRLDYDRVVEILNRY